MIGIKRMGRLKRFAVIVTSALVLACPHHAARAEDLPRGIVVALREAALSTELTVPIIKIGFREGERFAKGDRLITFDCRRYQAELKSVEAQHREAELTLESNVYLKRRGATGDHDVEIAKARAQKAAAEVEAIKVRLSQCDIKAPFAGSVAELAVKTYEMAPSGRPFMRIVSSDALEIQLLVSSGWLGWLAPGARFEFMVDELGTTIPAKVLRVAGKADPVSQTVKIYAASIAPVAGLLPGMSGSARFAKVGH